MHVFYTLHRTHALSAEILSDDAGDVIDLTHVIAVAPPQGGRKERRKQQRRMDKIAEQLRDMEDVEARMAEEEEMQRALEMSITQEERDREAAERKRLLEEQHAAYLESLAVDKAVRTPCPC